MSEITNKSKNQTNFLLDPLCNSSTYQNLYLLEFVIHSNIYHRSPIGLYDRIVLLLDLVPQDKVARLYLLQNTHEN